MNNCDYNEAQGILDIEKDSDNEDQCLTDEEFILQGIKTVSWLVTCDSNSIPFLKIYFDY